MEPIHIYFSQALEMILKEDTEGLYYPGTVDNCSATMSSKYNRTPELTVAVNIIKG